jgi:hypothetical protein
MLATASREDGQPAPATPFFSCRRWRQQREKLKQQHGRRFGELSYALGGYSSRRINGQSVDRPIEQWKADIDAVRATMEFAKSTGRLLTARAT